jgi:hypothetical protein
MCANCVMFMRVLWFFFPRYAVLKSQWRAAGHASVATPLALRGRCVVLPTAATEHLLPKRLVLALHKDQPNAADGVVVLSQQRRADLVASALLRQASSGAGAVDMTDNR